MKAALCVSYLLLSFLCAHAQRDFYFRDSTSYPINNNITYIAGKRTLYRLSSNEEISLLRDFTIATDTTYYIRDVDFVNEHKGYVLLGRYHIGSETYLYVTEDAGISFRLDTSFYGASLYKSINQMQIIDSSTFVLFDGYYESSLIRSFDSGRTWDMWFNSMIAHYFQLHKCNTNSWYLIGTPGDGFGSYSFPIPDSLWTLNNIPMFMSDCHNGAEYCVRVWRDGDRDRETDFIAKQIDTLSQICGNVTHVDQPQIRNIVYYPNPITDDLCIDKMKGANYEVYNVVGKLCMQGFIDSNKFILYTANLPQGTYWIRINSQHIKIVKK